MYANTATRQTPQTHFFVRVQEPSVITTSSQLSSDNGFPSVRSELMSAQNNVKMRGKLEYSFAEVAATRTADMFSMHIM